MNMRTGFTWPTTGWKTRATTFAAVVAMLASGCAGGDAEAYTASLQAGTYAGEAAPLPMIARVTWEAAPPGCEGRLVDVQSFGVAEGQPELIVALTSRSELACVDTYSAVESELVELGSGRVDGLWLGYVATLQDMEVLDAPDVQGQTRSTRPVSQAWRSNEQVRAEEPEPAPNITGVAGLSLLDMFAEEPEPATNEPAPGPDENPSGANSPADGMSGMNASRSRE